MKNISKETLGFLKEVRVNNNRTWFLDNKARYEKAKKELEAFSIEWISDLRTFDKSMADPDMKGYVFRIYRDARFAKGVPYKSNLGILAVKGGKPAMHERSGYYLQIESGNCFLAAGAYMPPGKWLGDIRDSITNKRGVFRSLIESKNFKKLFSFEGRSLKVGPRGYSKDDKDIDLLKMKGFIAIHRFSDEEVMDTKFSTKLKKLCEGLLEFNEYLNGCKK